MTSTVTVVLLHVTDLPCKDVASKNDPYVTMRLGGEHKKESAVYKNGGNDVSLREEKFIWTYKYGTDATLSFKVLDKDLLTADDVIGKCAVNILGLEDGEWEGWLQLHGNKDEESGKLQVRIMCDISPEGIPRPRPPFKLVPARVHRNAFFGCLSNSNTTDGLATFDTYEVSLAGVAEIFGNRWQANYDDEHAPMFADNVKGAAIRAALSAEHTMFYRQGVKPKWLSSSPRSILEWLGTGKQFTDMLLDGIRCNQRRVYTYALLDSGLYFSETGVQTTKDIGSKHAVHADAATRVRFAGTFRIVMDPANPGVQIMLIDNDSGTYRPNGDDFVLVKRVMAENFPELQVMTLNVIHDQPEETKTFIGPCEVENALGIPRVYPGKWVWDIQSPQQIRSTMGKVVSAQNG